MSKSVSSLSSAYDAADPSNAAPSAVASLASRFDAPPPVTGPPKVADKLSGIASTFGSTIDQDIPGRPPRRTPLKPKTAPTPPPETNVVAEAPGRVGDVAARFDGRFTPEEAAPNAFASAHERFLRFEADTLPPAETRVSGIAKSINTADKESRAPPPGLPNKEMVIAPPPPAGTGVGVKVSVFESGTDADVKSSGGNGDVPTTTGGNQFAEAAKRFAEAEKQDSKKAADPDAPPEDTAQSRFADAARLFGGS